MTIVIGCLTLFGIFGIAYLVGWGFGEQNIDDRIGRGMLTIFSFGAVALFAWLVGYIVRHVVGF